MKEMTLREYHDFWQTVDLELSRTMRNKLDPISITINHDIYNRLNNLYKEKIEKSNVNLSTYKKTVILTDKTVTSFRIDTRKR